LFIGVENDGSTFLLRKNVFFPLFLYNKLKRKMYSSDEEDLECPLCMEELDIADRNFRPCPCGYKV
jgi:hypothetical protein